MIYRTETEELQGLSLSPYVIIQSTGFLFKKKSYSRVIQIKIIIFQSNSE